MLYTCRLLLYQRQLKRLVAVPRCCVLLYCCTVVSRVYVRVVRLFVPCNAARHLSRICWASSRSCCESVYNYAARCSFARVRPSALLQIHAVFVLTYA